jgi:hypothetical protein
MFTMGLKPEVYILFHTWEFENIAHKNNSPPPFRNVFRSYNPIPNIKNTRNGKK